MHLETDPLGEALLDYLQCGHTSDIQVESNITENECIPVLYLFRSYEEMPKKEQYALSLATGKILDIGAGSGAHTRVLQQRDLQVTALDCSVACCKAMQQQGIHQIVQDDIFTYTSSESYDTLLLLMNGLGIAGTLAQLENLFVRCRSLLKPGGKLIAESVDILYMYEEEDGSCSINLNGNYYGELHYRMTYKEHTGAWFPWLYVSKDLALDIALKAGFKLIEIRDGEDSDYLMCLQAI